MQLSTKARYAVRAMVELALCYSREPVKLKEIAGKQDISLKYLEQVMFPLRINNYVKTHKGSQGGYVMTRSPEEVNVLEIVQCVEGSLSPVDCVDNPETCNRADICATREVWVGLKKSIYDELGNISLAELAKKQKEIYEES